MYKILVISHLLSKLKGKPFLLKVGSDTLAFAEDLIVSPVNIDFRVYIDLLLLACLALLLLTG